MSIDNKIIIFLILLVMFVMMLDDGQAAQRWCETYQFCEDEK